MEQPKSYDDLVKGLGMQIEAGKYYRTRSGGKVGPLKKDHSWFVCDGFSYLCNGERMSGAAMGDLIAEWTEDQHEGTVSLDTHALPDAIIPTMSPAEALQELDLREREDDPMHGLSVDGFVDAYKSAGEAAVRSIYLSGPMKGYPQSNYPLFNAVAEQLRRAGHRVYNPAEFGADTPFDGFPIRQAFAAYSKFICEEADAIILLPGWEASRGANAEHALAENCGIEIIPFDRLSTTIATEGTF